MMKKPSVGSTLLRKMYIFVRTQPIYDAFALKGDVVFRIAHNM